MSDFILTKGLSFSYTDDSGKPTEYPAVSDVSLTIGEGEYVAVLGHNGSGKSTFAKLLNMILLANSGTLVIDGEEMEPSKMENGGKDVEDIIFNVRKKVGMVFQNPDNQIVATIVEEDVAFGPENLGVEPAVIRERIDDALKTVGMSEYMNHATHSLSGGQKQRVAVAGVIAMRPKCIIFDESTAMLDPLGRKEVMRAIEKLNREEHITIINITHYMNEAALADRVIVINDGKVYMDGTPKEIFSRVDDLSCVGLEAPQATELLHKLRAYGYDVPEDCIDADECAGIICDLIRKENEKKAEK